MRNYKIISLIALGLIGLLLVTLYWYYFVFSSVVGCIQVIQEARNPIPREVRFFPTPWDVPIGWQNK